MKETLRPGPQSHGSRIGRWKASPKLRTKPAHFSMGTTVSFERKNAILGGMK